VFAVGTNSTQERSQWKQSDCWSRLRHALVRKLAFLKSGQPLALNEKGTLKWYAFKIGPRKFGIFDTFANEAGRNAHLTGEIAKALGARASELFAVSPQVEKVEILANTPLKG
jgi:hypothetical protein